MQTLERPRPALRGFPSSCGAAQWEDPALSTRPLPGVPGAGAYCLQPRRLALQEGLPTPPNTGAHSGHTCSQLALPGNEQLHQVQVATRSCSMQGGPALTVTGVDLGPSLQELLHHLPEVINAALQIGQPEQGAPPVIPPMPPHPHMADLVQRCETVLIGQVRADPAVQELAD